MRLKLARRGFNKKYLAIYPQTVLKICDGFER